MSLDDIDENTLEFCIGNNEEALTVIMNLGLLELFPKHDGKTPSRATVIGNVNKHPSHWIVAVQLVGQTVNGVKSPYVVYGFLKSVYSCEHANNQALKNVGLLIALGLTQIKDTRRSKHGLWVEGRFKFRPDRA